MPPADDAPLGEDELDRLLAPVDAARRIALAVSGGADSLALLVAVDRWRGRRRGRPEALVLTVDHRLRPGSDREARHVAALALARRLDVRVLAADRPPPEADIEAAARRLRYRLLTGAAREAGATHLLLAHHRDDQAETLLMRLCRGSGVFGLAAMRPSVAAGGLTLFRPFLDIGRARLAATAAAAGLVPSDDPMNRDSRFLRTRIRRLMPLLAAEGLDAAALAGTAARLRQAAEAIEAEVDRVIAEAATVDTLAVARLPGRAFAAAPEAVRHRLLVRLLLAVGGEEYPPRFERLLGLDRALLAAPGAGGRLKRTLAGVVVEARRDGLLLFYREVGRGLPELAAEPGSALVWDRRFRLILGGRAPRGLTVAALGEAGRAALGARVAGAPAAALAALPALRRKGLLVAVPPLAWRPAAGRRVAAEAAEIVGERLRRPPLFPDFGGTEPPAP